jgi:hypothetical protein
VTRPYRICLTMALFSIYAAMFSQPGFAQFETRSVRNVPNNEYAMSSADFNGDGKIDVALAGNELFIALGNGDGTFQAPVGYFIAALYIAVADFNGDGIPDIVLADGPDISILLGNGDGTFQPAIMLTVSGNTTSVAVGDFNNDHKTDVVVVDGSNVSVLLGNGDGTFQAPIDNESFVGASKLAIGDFNNDHKLDVAVVGSYFSSSEYGIMLGNGDGTLQPPLITDLPSVPDWVTAADLNGDGRTDIAIGWYLATGLSTYFGKGDGTFGPGKFYDTTFEADQILAYDLNGDGILDLAVPTGKPDGLTVLWGKGKGVFEPAKLYPTLYTGLASVADLNNDGMPDFVFGIDDAVSTMLNTGSLRLFPTSPIDFVVQTIGTHSAAQTLLLENIGNAEISISSLKSAGDFQLVNNCGTILVPGNQCAVNVTFAPTSTGNLRGQITLQDSASSKPQVVLLSGVSTPLQVSPSQINFGDQKVGKTSSPQQISMTNLSTAAVQIDAILVGGNDNNDFHQTNNCGSLLNAGSSCTISATFTPHKSGERSGNVNFMLSGVPTPRFVILSGTGI